MATQLSTNVVPIRKGFRIRPDAIAQAKVASGAQLIRRAYDGLNQAQDEQTARQLAGLARAAERLLPRNNLRCIVSTLDEQQDFILRAVEVEVARSHYNHQIARSMRSRVIGGEDVDTEPAFQAWRQAVMDLARQPARTREHLRRKKEIIGRIWLNAEGDWYDQLRACVAADEDWLEANRPSRKRRA